MSRRAGRRRERIETLDRAGRHSIETRVCDVWSQSQLSGKARKAAVGFHLGPWAVEPTSRRIRLGGQSHRLSPKAMRVLECLARSPGAVVSRRALLDEVWSGVVVGEEVLTHSIAELRRHLGDSSRSPSYIETVHKAGYRLLADVTPSPPSTRGAMPASLLNEVMAIEVPAGDAAVRPGPCEGAELQAYLLCLQAQDLLFRGGKENIRGAVALFSDAIALDPASAQAYAGQAIALVFLFMYYEPIGHHLDKALDAATAALRLDSRQATCHAALAWALSSTGAFGRAMSSFMTAVRLEPGSFGAHYLFGRACFSEGRFDLAAAVLERAGQIHGEDFHAWLLAAKARRSLGDEARARSAHRKALRRVEAYLEDEPDDLRAICDKACCLVGLGQIEQALAWAAPHGELSDPMIYYLACAFARAGEIRPALDCLERVVETGWSHPGWLRSDPDLDSLRKELRFQRIERSLGLH